MPHPIFNFEWNATKAAANLRNHRVDFEEAATAFEDPSALVVEDPEHSQDEPRQILIGYSYHRRLLFVSFVHRTDDLIRIISARKAGAQEFGDYEKNNRFV